jgi:hypothetical protein
MRLLGKVIPSAFPIMIVHALTGYESLYQRLSCLPSKKNCEIQFLVMVEGIERGFTVWL